MFQIFLSISGLDFLTSISGAASAISNVGPGMGAKDIKRQQPNVKAMKRNGAEVIPVYTGSQTLVDAVSECMRYWVANCKLINPFVINTETGQTVLEPFLTSVTRDTTFMMGSDKILTLAEPTPTLLEKYLDLTKE